jgi:hypothetical protein
VKLLTFLARHFRWRAHSRTLANVAESDDEDGLEDCVVVFVHAEVGDEGAEAAKRCKRHVLKHVKWLAGKRSLERVALHSFTHLGAESAAPEFAQAFLAQLAERLEAHGFEVKQTPFGHFCEWELSVHGESLAKVWKEV